MISSIHVFILKIQQILGSHELKRPMSFLTKPTQKSLSQLLAFLDLYQHAKNQFTPSEIQSILESHDQTSHTQS